jgi:LacI family transcriptional regulator
MKFESVTIKDIAKALGLSPSTVSRALRGSYEISGQTKKLVTDYAGKMNYRPNPIAQSLKERRSRSIGIIVSEIANNFFSQAINGIESIAYNRGYHVIISQSHESYEREVVNVEHLASRSVDGLLVSISNATKDLSHLSRLHERGLPIVFFDRVTDEIKTHQVVANNYIGTFNTTEHLINEKFVNIAHITNAPSLSITKERLSGYKDALKKHGLPFYENCVQYCHNGGMLVKEMEDAVANLLALPNRPDAILAASDRLTMGCLSVLIQHGIKIPEQMGIAGFTNTNLAELFHPRLTTVRQPAFEMGKYATEMLLKIIESKRPVTEFETRVLDTELMIRQSSVKK